MTYTNTEAALIIIDAQQNMLHMGEGISPQVQAAVSKLEHVVAQNRLTSHMPMIHVAMSDHPISEGLRYEAQGPALKLIKFIKGAEPEQHEPLFLKTKYSALKNPALLSDLKERGIKDVYLGGFHTSACVQDTAIDLVKAGFNVHVISDATYARSEQRTQEGLKAMSGAGVKMISSKNFRRMIWPERPISDHPDNPHCAAKSPKPLAGTSAA